jgi:hypothetical protein
MFLKPSWAESGWARKQMCSATPSRKVYRKVTFISLKPIHKNVQPKRRVKLVYRIKVTLTIKPGIEGQDAVA